MKTSFDKYEKVERKFIEWYIKSDPLHKLDEISPIGSYNRNDFVMLSGNSYILGEVKVRSFEWDKYPTAVIELDKVQALTRMFEPFRIMGETNKLYYYAVYKKSRTILIFDLLTTPMTLSYEWCPITTAEDKGNKYKVMANFSINNAIKITY
jgi:hypothetical protein